MDLYRRNLILWLLASAGVAEAAGEAQGYETVSWPALLPPGWNMQAVLSGLRLDSVDDNDLEAEELSRKVRELLDKAPPNSSVDNRRLRLWGYMVPLQFAKQRHVSEFLLVPFFGACIHAPAPPANQVVHVVPAEPVSLEGRGSSAVWVSGKMKVMRADSDKGVACYRMTSAEVKAYTA